MAKTLTLTQTRPNTGVDFHEASAEFKTLKQELVDAGTLVDNGGNNDESGLKRTWTLTFTNEENWQAFENDVRATAYVADREAYNTVNGIVEQISHS